MFKLICILEKWLAFVAYQAELALDKDQNTNGFWFLAEFSITRLCRVMHRLIDCISQLGY